MGVEDAGLQKVHPAVVLDPVPAEQPLALPGRKRQPVEILRAEAALITHVVDGEDGDRRPSRPGDGEAGEKRYYGGVPVVDVQNVGAAAGASGVLADGPAQ